MRIFLDRDPLLNPDDFFHEDSPWPAKWIGHPDHRGEQSVVIAYRRQLKLDKPLRCRIHVSADQRYELFLDGERLGRGPERGDHHNWFYESYQLDLPVGQHTLVARTWWLSDDAPTPYAQITSQPAFFLLAESGDVPKPVVSDPMNPHAPDSPTEAIINTRGGEANQLLSTGIAAWECKRLAGYTFEKPQAHNAFLVSGAKVRIDGAQFPWGFESGSGDGWQPVTIVSGAAVASLVAESKPRWLLRPAPLPAMIENRVPAGSARHVEQVDAFDNYTRIVESKNNLAGEMDQWNKLLKSGSQLTIPPRTMRRAIIDLDNYFCGFTDLVTRGGGAGSTIRVFWAESLFTKPNSWDKGNRDQIEGKVFNGIGDTFLVGPGDQPQRFETLWWEAGRYLEVVVQTQDQPLSIESLAIRETHYPHPFESKFEASDKRLADVIPIALRTLEMCSHETYMDCPYYEQLMYVGDTRLQVLTTYAMSRDDRLPRKALEVFDFSRAAGHNGLTMARYPTKILQTIPPFSLWWIAMLHDYMMWRGDAEFIRARMPGVRAVIDAFLRYVNKNDLLESPDGWNFVDWVPGWFHGMPPAGHDGINGTLNWHLAYTLQLASELEDFVGEPDLAKRCAKRGVQIATASETFWHEGRGLFAEDLGKTVFSEHTQCIALLSGLLDPARHPKLAPSLLADPNLARTTIYFTHYLFETYRQLGRPDRLLDRMSLWFNLRPNGSRTTVESPEPTRSDCHAWGAHPVYHYFASILGIRPLVPGFARVSIQPQLGPLSSTKGTMVHPKGVIRVDVQVKDGKVSGEVELPEGITGQLTANGAIQELHCGKQRV